MVDVVVIFYLFFMVLGILWIIYKLCIYVSNQRKRAYQMGQVFTAEELMAYAKAAKPNQNTNDSTNSESANG